MTEPVEPGARRPQQNRAEVKSLYVRHRNVMAVFADLKPLYVDYYLHLMQNDLKPAEEHDQILKDALAALVLHLTARPVNEMSAWTVNLQGTDPVINLFATGDSEVGNVCGRVFTEAVRQGERSLFFSQVTRPRNPIRQSTIEVHGTDPFRWVEQYYDQSEQVPCKLFRLGDEEFGAAVVQPDCDLEWFEGLDAAGMERLNEDEEVRLLETRRYHFRCGCTEDLIHVVLAPLARSDIDGLFGGEDAVRVQCPRCAATFPITRTQLDDYLRANPPEEDGA